MGKLLDRLNILVTRPEQQANVLCKLLEDLGGIATRFPAIEIKQTNDLQAVHNILVNIEQYDIGIFVSSNAVDWTFSLLDGGPLSHLQLITIGSATTNRLMQRLSDENKPVLSQPITTNAGSDSLSLLKLDALDVDKVDGRKIAIFRGQGSNDLLADKLRERGAKVQYAEVYRRDCPVYDKDFIDSIWSLNKPNIIVATSNNGLKNLYDLLDQQQRELLLNTQLVIMGQRMLDCSAAIGFNQVPIVAEDSSDQGILNSIVKWVKSNAWERQPNEQ